MNKREESILTVLDAYIGKTVGVGDTRVDEERFENLELEISIIEFLISDVFDTYGKTIYSQFGSVQDINYECKNFLKQLKEDIEDVFENE